MPVEVPDIVIIGSGAGGGASAWALTRQGFRVTVLEAGPVYDPLRDYRLDSRTWEQTRFPHKVPIAGRQTFAPLQPLEVRWQDLRSWNHITGPMSPDGRRQFWGYHHVVGVGGSTLAFTGEAHRLHPQAMQMRSRFGVAADWPFTYRELEPWYLEAERLIGVAGPPADPLRPRSAPCPLPAHPLSHASRKLLAGAAKLGLRWVPNTVAALSEPYAGRPPCNYCGNCARGCPRMDKGSVDITFLRQAEATGNCEILSGCQVTRIEAGANDRVAGVHYIDAQGAGRWLATPAVIVACGAVETPRLLLASSGKHAPDGLANESGQVGKHFMETLAWTSSGLHPEPLGSHRGLPSDSICWDYNAPDAIPGMVGGCRFTPGMAEADLVGPINYATRVVEGWGHAHKAAMREQFGRALSIGAIGESLPNPGSFIDLDPKEQDDNGIHKARIHSHLDETELHRLAFMARTCREILSASGVEDIFEEYGSYDAFSATHVFGTCRMGNNPGNSVVDPHGRSHRWRNLFVTDASVFPSSGGGESPSLTIEALAIRSAVHLAAQAKRREI